MPNKSLHLTKKAPLRSAFLADEAGDRNRREEVGCDRVDRVL